MIPTKTDFIPERTILEIDEDNQDTWLQMRRDGIGGSDFASILGEHPYKSRLRVWREKLGEETPIENRYLWWGRQMEQLVLTRLQELTGLDVYRFPVLLRHDEHKIMQSSPDGLIGLEADFPGGPGLIEAKNVNEFNRHEWGTPLVQLIDPEDEPKAVLQTIMEEGSSPFWYRYQLWHNLHVAGLKWGLLAACLGGNSLYVDFVSTEETGAPGLDMVYESEKAFWRYVEEKEEPPPDSTEQSGDILQDVYSESNGEYITLPEEALRHVEQYQQLRNVEKEAKKKKEKHRNELFSMIGNNLGGYVGDYRVKFTPISETEVSYTRDAYRRMSISKQD